jgi:predicted GNAT family acetyltransferase
MVRASGRDVVAYCPYVKAWLARHADYQDLVRHVQS